MSTGISAAADSGIEVHDNQLKEQADKSEMVDKQMANEQNVEEVVDEMIEMDTASNDGKRKMGPRMRSEVLERGMTGRVAMYQRDKGFGFVACDDNGEEVFFHHSNIFTTKRLYEGEYFYDLIRGDRLEFDIVRTARGVQAIAVSLANHRFVPIVDRRVSRNGFSSKQHNQNVPVKKNVQKTVKNQGNEDPEKNAEGQEQVEGNAKPAKKPKNKKVGNRRFPRNKNGQQQKGKQQEKEETASNKSVDSGKGEEDQAETAAEREVQQEDHNEGEEPAQE